MERDLEESFAKQQLGTKESDTKLLDKASGHFANLIWKRRSRNHKEGSATKVGLSLRSLGLAAPVFSEFLRRVALHQHQG